MNLVFIFILGARGNRRAWEKGNWESVEQFQATQRKWALWIIPVFLGVVLLSVAMVLGISSIIKSTDAYQIGMDKALASPEITRILGKPVEVGFFTQGNVQIQG